MEKAAFSFKGYRFNNVMMDLENIPSNVTFNLKFTPNGEYFQQKRLYNLFFEFEANVEDRDISVIKIGCVASFEFKESIPYEEIPIFFYPNSIAIVFPYIRAFISTITLQANIKPILIPTLNLTSLQNILKENTIVK